MIRKFDFLVIGSGVAGMSYALQVAASGKGKVALVCKTSIEEANTAKAQGGIASVTNLKVDDFNKHIRDTMIAGDYISDPRAVEQVVRNAPAGIERLLKWGVNFDKNEDGSFDLHREGGHSEFRILHHADDTGFEIQRGLIEAVKKTPNITLLENHFAVEIITQHHLGVEVTRRTPDIECYGAYVLDPDTKKIDTILSRVTVLATGGCGAVYATTTNPDIATGDGIAMAYRAKATVKDMEFIQFHPTALFHSGETHPAYLITEAMRGYGGILRLPNGEEFMQKYDKRLSLAPRDIVARAIDKEMKIHGIDHVCLDVTHKNPEETKHHSRTSTPNASPSALTSRSSTFPLPLAPIISAAASRWTSTPAQASIASMPLANALAQVCTAETAWLPIRSLRLWFMLKLLPNTRWHTSTNMNSTSVCRNGMTRAR